MRRRRSQLVCQYVEKLSRVMLEEYQAVIRSYVRRSSGIYALYRKGKLYYVGLASRLLGRLKGHLRDRHAGTWDHFSVYLTAGTGYMREIESVLIRIAAPSGNKQRGKFSRAENLRKRLKADFRRIRRQEESLLFDGYSRLRRTLEGDAPSSGLAHYLPLVRKLRATYKGRILKALVRRDGRIRFRGKTFDSPSKAASMAIGRGRNGWTFWTYQRAPGVWVPIKELR